MIAPALALVLSASLAGPARGHVLPLSGTATVHEDRTDIQDIPDVLALPSGGYVMAAMW